MTGRIALELWSRDQYSSARIFTPYRLSFAVILIFSSQRQSKHRFSFHLTNVTEPVSWKAVKPRQRDHQQIRLTQTEMGSESQVSCQIGRLAVLSHSQRSRIQLEKINNIPLFVIQNCRPIAANLQSMDLLLVCRTRKYWRILYNEALSHTPLCFWESIARRRAAVCSSFRTNHARPSRHLAGFPDRLRVDWHIFIEHTHKVSAAISQDPRTSPAFRGMEGGDCVIMIRKIKLEMWQ
jgi:hypothetical protein